jgi:hypothetical protein
MFVTGGHGAPFPSRFSIMTVKRCKLAPRQSSVQNEIGLRSEKVFRDQYARGDSGGHRIPGITATRRRNVAAGQK